MLYIDPKQIWHDIKKEAYQLTQCEPMLASFYHSALLQYNDLETALSCILANKLANHIISKTDLSEIIQDIYRQYPAIIISAAYDIYAARHRDPTVDKYSTVILYLKGFHALQVYRLYHFLWNTGRHALALYMQHESSVLFAVDIHPAARLGQGILLDHATGIVIGETTVIADNVSILQAVTLGSTGKDNGDRHPKIQEGVIIGAGAKILGNIEIGCWAKVGAGSVVLHPVPAYTTVVGVPANIVKNKHKNDISSIHINQYPITIFPGFEYGDGI
ncbi:serine O-acetyltransferase [Candidatus Erwinia haradaeae]|uniref:Serine acetyltransferase n=1 Tax=Candidatus Erwinia haradaeae TaxID=1922217 RepID=A0A451DG49_9GAMM|nr:serine O-acetyltransferase [Candidatus Erwinia haradaeae]VFP85605.1 Serine acetyltransferase [Candidatus Erwinia haradaeae]